MVWPSRAPGPSPSPGFSLQLSEGMSDSLSHGSLKHSSDLPVPEPGAFNTAQGDCSEFIHWNWKHRRSLLLIPMISVLRDSVGVTVKRARKLSAATEFSSQKDVSSSFLLVLMNDWREKRLRVRFCAQFHHNPFSCHSPQRKWFGLFLFFF